MRLNLAVFALVCAMGITVQADAKGKWQSAPEAGRTELPTCLDRDRRPIEGNNNEEVLRWKEETKNQFKDRALIDGVLVGVLLDRASHLHLEVNLSERNSAGDRRENLELIYNKSFGEVGRVQPGMAVQACGDYITSNAPSGHYPASPVGAILHWIHKSNNPGRHADGFLAIAGTLYGMEDEGSSPDFRDFTRWLLQPAFLQ